MTVLRDLDTVIIHVPKTGGSSVRWPAIKKFGVRYSCQHCNFSSLPEKYKEFRKVSFTRNPIDWYASRYFFDKKKFISSKQKLEPFSDALSDGYKLNFEDTLMRMLNITDAFRDKKTLDLFKERVIKEVTNNYQCWWVSYFDDIESLTPEYFENKSLYQWFNDKVGLYECDVVYRLEDEFEEGMFKEFGELPLKHRNKTGRESSETLYTDRMKELVLDTEKDFIGKFGY